MRVGRGDRSGRDGMGITAKKKKKGDEKNNVHQKMDVVSPRSGDRDKDSGMVISEVIVDNEGGGEEAMVVLEDGSIGFSRKVLRGVRSKEKSHPLTGEEEEDLDRRREDMMEVFCLAEGISGSLVGGQGGMRSEKKSRRLTGEEDEDLDWRREDTRGRTGSQAGEEENGGDMEDAGGLGRKDGKRKWKDVSGSDDSVGEKIVFFGWNGQG